MLSVPIKSIVAATSSLAAAVGVVLVANASPALAATSTTATVMSTPAKPYTDLPAGGALATPDNHLIIGAADPGAGCVRGAAIGGTAGAAGGAVVGGIGGTELGPPGVAIGALGGAEQGLVDGSFAGCVAGALGSFLPGH